MLRPGYKAVLFEHEKWVGNDKRKDYAGNWIEKDYEEVEGAY